MAISADIAESRQSPRELRCELPHSGHLLPLDRPENHTRGTIRFGIWVAPHLLDGPRVGNGSPVSRRHARHAGDSRSSALALELRCQDTVDCHLDVYVRRIEVIDLQGRAREVKLFFTRTLTSTATKSGTRRTTIPTPGRHPLREEPVLPRQLLQFQRVAVDYFSVGVRRGAEGSHPGRSQRRRIGRAVSLLGTCGVDQSAVRVHVPAGDRARPSTGCCSQCYEEVVHITGVVCEKTPSELIRRTSDYWRAWVRKEPRSFGDLPSLLRTSSIAAFSS